MSAAVKCAACNDTGSLPGSHELDCAHCGAAVERVKFHQWAACTLSSAASEADDWAIYQRGKAAGAAESAWMDIATAPLDGTTVRLLSEHGEDVGHFAMFSPDSDSAYRWRGIRGEWDTKLGNGEPLKWQGIAGAAQAVPAVWQPIEAAPKSMTSCLYLVGRYCVQGFVDATGEVMVQSEVSPHWRRMRGKPTHWMPLPAAPKAP